MLKIQKELNGGSLELRLVGDIDERCHLEEFLPFQELQASPPAELVVQGKAVRRINSSGIKAWIRYFQGVQALKIPLRFVGFSVCLVEQANQILNFTCGGQIESFYVPFVCRECGIDLVGLFETAPLKKGGVRLPALRCSKCGGRAQFDDIEEEYFSFLRR